MKHNPFKQSPPPANIPIVGQVADYVIGLPLVIPHQVADIAMLTDSVARATARKAKGDIAVICGDRYRMFSYEEFVRLIFDEPEQEALPDTPESPILAP